MEEILTNWWSLLEEEVIKTLELYKSLGAIKEFNIILNETLNKGVELTVVVTIEERTLTFDIFRSEKLNSNLKALNGLVGYSFLVSKETTADEVCWEIFACFNERANEYQIEISFCSLFSNGFRADHASIKEDIIDGIDVYIHGKSGKMPLQLLNNNLSQFEHRRDHPNIPSIIYRKNSSPDWAFSWTKILYDAYFSEPRMILHKNSLETPPK